jgi:hypothetical protein
MIITTLNRYLDEFGGGGTGYRDIIEDIQSLKFEKWMILRIMEDAERCKTVEEVRNLAARWRETLSSVFAGLECYMGSGNMKL